MTNIISLDFERNPLERLYAMRRKYDEGGYWKLIVIGIGHDGKKDRVELKRPEDYEAPCLVVATRRIGSLYPPEMLAQMRTKYDRGGYKAYMAVGVTNDGTVEEITVSSPTNYRSKIAS